MDCTEGIDCLPTGYKYCIVTDPPFNVGYHYNEYKDKMDEDEYYEWLGNIVNGYPCVIIHYPESLYKFAFQIGKFPTRVLSWVYNSNTPRQHRDIAYFDIVPDMNRVRQPYKNPTDKRIAARIAAGCGGGQNVRLDGGQSGEERQQESTRNQPPMPDARRGDAPSGRCFARRLRHSRPFPRQRHHLRSRLTRASPLRRLRAEQGVFRHCPAAHRPGAQPAYPRLRRRLKAPEKSTRNRYDISTCNRYDISTYNRYDISTEG